MRSSAEIEDDDNVVHDETSPKNQKTIPEAEFTEITNGPLPEKSRQKSQQYSKKKQSL